MIRFRLVVRAGLLALFLGAAAPETDISIVVLDHAVEPPDRLAASDFVDSRMPAAAARGALGLHDLVGMEVTRRLAAGSIVRTSDIIRPQLVRRGEPVTITVRSGALLISTAGRALSGGAAGAVVRVVSVATNHTLDGIIEGPGMVRVAAN